MIIYGIFDLLLRAQVTLGSLDRYVAGQELDLFEFAAGNMAESGAGSPQIVGRNLFNPDALREIPNDVPHHLFSYTISPDAPALLIDRNREPDTVPDSWAHSSIRFLTQSGTGTVRTCLPLPIRSTMAQWPSRS